MKNDKNLFDPMRQFRLLRKIDRKKRMEVVRDVQEEGEDVKICQ